MVLKLRHLAFTLASLFALLTVLPACQQAPTFEVASVKNLARQPDAIHGIEDFIKPGGRFIAPAVTLTGMVSFAYSLKEPSVELINTPHWSNSRFFQIQAEPGPNYPDLSAGENRERIRLMVQGLLADRFHLAVHHETRSLPVYNLLVAKGGVKMKPVAAPQPPLPPQGSAGGTLRPDGAQFSGTAASVSAIASLLSAVLQRPVVDKTGVTGNYDFALTWSVGEDGARPVGGQLPAAYITGLFYALETQLGLRLTAATGPVDVLVVDSAQLPASDR